MRVFTALLLSLALAAVSRPAAAQIGGVRFEISGIGDTTIVFSRGKARWVSVGLQGVAIDPTRRDALVALFRVVQLRDSVVTAVITGQTTRVTTAHVALLDQPRKRWYQTSLFWIGMVIGAAVGTAAGVGAGSL